MVTVVEWEKIKWQNSRGRKTSQPLRLVLVQGLKSIVGFGEIGI
jgi:hypothetical protein